MFTSKMAELSQAWLLIHRSPLFPQEPHSGGGGGEWLISPKGRGYSVLTPRHRQGTVAE